jgi:hypothetical protein
MGLLQPHGRYGCGDGEADIKDRLANGDQELRMKRMTPPLLLAMAVSWAIPALAFTHTATGFSIDTPPGYVTTLSSHRTHDVTVAVNSRSGKPVATNSDKNLCKVAYKTAPQNNTLTRAQINALVTDPARQKMIQNVFSRVFNITKTSRFVHQGYHALELHGAPKFGPDHENARVFISIIETRMGRASLICATSVSAFPSGVKTFRTIRATMKIPG